MMILGVRTAPLWQKLHGVRLRTSIFQKLCQCYGRGCSTKAKRIGGEFTRLEHIRLFSSWDNKVMHLKIISVPLKLVESFDYVYRCIVIDYIY